MLLVFNRASVRVNLRDIQVPMLLFCLVVCWVIIQTLPMTPTAWHHPYWNNLAITLGRETSSRITLDVNSSLTALMRLLSYAGVFWMSLQYCSSAARAQQVLSTICITGMAYATYGLFIYFTGSEMILWFHKWAYRPDLTSTFVNRNNYATYAGLGLLCGIGLVLQNILDEFRSAIGFRWVAREIIETLLEQSGLLIVAIPVIGTALLLSHSRGGVGSFVVGLAVLLLAPNISPYLRGRANMLRVNWSIAIVFAVMATALFSLSGEGVEARFFERSISEENRISYYRSTIRAIREFPLSGTGYGTFQKAFRSYKEPSISSNVDKAHNTYLENAMELGLPAAVALVGAVAGLGTICLFGIRRRRRNVMYPIVGLAATALVGAHSLVDFSLQIPAIAVTYALIMGAACAQSWPSPHSRNDLGGY